MELIGMRCSQVLVLFVLLTPLIAGQSADWDINCPKYCKCKWVSGKKSADCSGGGLTLIPNTLNPDIQTLDLSRNDIGELRKNIFQEVLLVNLHKLNLRNCNIYEIHKDAFEGLKILIELDLSENYIKKLDSNTFKKLDRLRVLSLVNNNLQIIMDGMLSNFKYLQTVDFSRNNLTYVSEKAFTHDPKLLSVILKDNKIRHMKPFILEPNQKLSSLVLNNNPWKCDCNLKSFRNWTIENNLYTPPTSCDEPNHLRGRLWTEVTADKFACKPVIIEPDVGVTLTLRNEKEAMISCKVYGDPQPAVNWILNNRIIENDPRKGDDRHFIIRENGVDTIRWVNLTIRNPRPQDRGELICSATNPGGVEERNVTIALATGIIPGLDGDSDLIWLPLILGIVIGVFVLCIVLLCLFYCLWRRKRLPSKNDSNRSNGNAMDDTEMEKSLITTVNPVTKPPRRCEPPSSVTNAGTELSEINRTLLDNDSVFNPNNGGDEESHSLEFIESSSKLNKEISLSEYPTSDRPYPPDLLSFPARAAQVSPAGSLTTTLPEYSRATPSLQSPMHSPLYGTLPNNLFRTLPYSRSHSPFNSPVCVPVPSRQGYVTIPRRPRVPSWSAPSPGLGNEVAEPVYDNLGLRTTADGSSVLSLNKSVEPSPVGMRGRPLPATPVYQQNGLPVYYTPIEEHEPPPPPCAAPRPSNSRSSSFQKLPNSPTPGPEDDNSWMYRSRPEGASLNRPASREARLSGSVSPTTPDSAAKLIKVPPKPPPKPKKKSLGGPLFEDEGEDGTEV